MSMDKWYSDVQEGLRVLALLQASQESLEKKEKIFLSQVGFSENLTFYSHPTSIIDEDCEIGQGTKIWHFSPYS